MALVRKYQKAGGIEGPKKVLTYENVGTYDAEKLASSLTQSIESYVDELGLGAKDRQSFLKLGASMINAIKDGNVIKNTDGTFTMKAGNINVNRTVNGNGAGILKKITQQTLKCNRYVEKFKINNFNSGETLVNLR